MLSENAKRLLQYLVGRLDDIAPEDPYTYFSYKKVHNDLGLELQGQTYGQSLRVQGLGNLAGWLFERRLPAITGIIVSADSFSPGKGYYEAFSKEQDNFKWWEQQIIESKNYNWASHVEVNHVKIEEYTNEKQNTWIFQGNPDNFKINAYISENRHIWWTMNQSHFLDEVFIGDTVYIWRADGKRRGTGGIVARGVVDGEPRPSDEIAPSEYWIDIPKVTDKYSVPIKVEDN